MRFSKYFIYVIILIAPKKINFIRLNNFPNDLLSHFGREVPVGFRSEIRTHLSLTRFILYVFRTLLFFKYFVFLKITDSTIRILLVSRYVRNISLVFKIPVLRVSKNYIYR